MGINSIGYLIRAIYLRIGPKEPVPDRKNISIVGICKRLGVMVMYFMHVWCDEHVRKCPIDLTRHINVSVCEVSKQYRQALVEHHDADRDSNQKDAENSK